MKLGCQAGPTSSEDAAQFNSYISPVYFPMYFALLLKHLYLTMASAFPEDNEEPMEMMEKTITDKLKEFNPRVHDRIIGEKLHHTLLEIKTAPAEENRFLDGYIYCWLIVQSAKSSTKENRFRVQLTWTGLMVKKEIERLYEIPPHFQTLIINGKVVSDAQTLEPFDVQPSGQIIYCVLTKKKLKNAGPVVKISDFVPPRAEREANRGGGSTAEVMEVESDGSSDTMMAEATGETSQPKAPSTSSSNRKKKKKKKSRKQGGW